MFLRETRNVWNWILTLIQNEQNKYYRYRLAKGLAKYFLKVPDATMQWTTSGRLQISFAQVRSPNYLAKMNRSAASHERDDSYRLLLRGGSKWGMDRTENRKRWRGVVNGQSVIPHGKDKWSNLHGLLCTPHGLSTMWCFHFLDLQINN